MRDSISIGTSPCAEECVQVGTDNYLVKATKECNIFIRQLERKFPIPDDLKELVRYKITRNPHDAGTYLDVVVEYDVSSEEAQDYAFSIEENTPELWDDDAIKELFQAGLKQVKLMNKDDDE